MCFVNSLGLGEEPSIKPVRRRLARSPGVRFKLDADATWAPTRFREQESARLKALLEWRRLGTIGHWHP